MSDSSWDSRYASSESDSDEDAAFEPQVCDLEDMLMALMRTDPSGAGDLGDEKWAKKMLKDSLDQATKFVNAALDPSAPEKTRHSSKELRHQLESYCRSESETDQHSHMTNAISAILGHFKDSPLLPPLEQPAKSKTSKGKQREMEAEPSSSTNHPPSDGTEESQQPRLNIFHSVDPERMEKYLLEGQLKGVYVSSLLKPEDQLEPLDVPRTSELRHQPSSPTSQSHSTATSDLSSEDMNVPSPSSESSSIGLISQVSSDAEPPSSGKPEHEIKRQNEEDHASFTKRPRLDSSCRDANQK